MHLKEEKSLLVLNLLQGNHGNDLTNKNERKTKGFVSKLICDAFRNSSDTE